MTLYLMGHYLDRQPEADALLVKLGKYKNGKSCLYVNKLADVDLTVLEDIIAADWQTMLRLFPAD